MGVRDLLVLLGLLSAVVQTTRESPMLSVSPRITATCGQPVTLHCNVSSSNDDLSITYLSWINQNNETVCRWKEGKLDPFGSGINCSFADQRLTLQFVHTPLHESQGLHRYLCKLRSNQGIGWKHTTVELKECCQEVEVAVTTERSTCTFTGVYPDRDVHWFHGDARLNASSATPQNKKSVDEQGYLSIISSLPGRGHTGPYSCCLWNAESQTYTRCKPFKIPPLPSELVVQTLDGSATPEGSIWRFFIVPVLLMML